jgi:hypothetical protein
VTRKTQDGLGALLVDAAEEWRPIPDYVGCYSVSNLGRIRSEPRVIDRPGPKGVLTVRGRILAQHAHPRTGYVHVSLNRNNRRHVFRVHSLVMLAFVGERPEGLETRHLDGNKTNNALSNLQWGTPGENALDKVRHGTHNFASRTHCPRRHLLVAPNLVRCLAKKGYRDCLSCNRARTTERNRRVRYGIETDWITLADLNYAEIMGKTDMRAA